MTWKGILSETDLGAYQMSKHALESFTDVLVPNQEQAALTINALLDQLVQLNEGHHTYSRDRLVTLLAEARGRAGRQDSRHW